MNTHCGIIIKIHNMLEGNEYYLWVIIKMVVSLNHNMLEGTHLHCDCIILNYGRGNYF